MKRNIANKDRLIRAIIAILLAVLYATGFVVGQGGITIMAIAVVALLTAITGICPLYGVCKLNTCGQ